MNQDFFLDTDITPEEVERVVKSLKSGKSGGADGLDPEHVKYGGPTLTSWMRHIFSAMVKLESIPQSLKVGVITPVYKGNGRDPLNPNSYRGITLTSVFSKCFDRILLDRMNLSLNEAGFPHAS